ncbi:MAG: alpha/beta hydrolase [Burkholderiaceae bacterium]
MPILDPEVQALLELVRKSARPPFEALSPEAARAAYAASWDIMQSPAQEVASTRDIGIAGPAGELQLRVYRGAGTPTDTPLPCLVFLHGGGWVIGNLESHDRLCRRLANLAGICVVAVDYRLAPEHAFPAALDDSAAALQWVHDNASALAILPERIAVGGDSAGGNLAAVLALMGRDGNAPRSMFQLLVYPVVDLRAQSDSYRAISAGVPLTASTMHYFIGHYTPQEADRLDWRASPLLAQSLAGTPPALVLTVGIDPLCDEGRAYAQRLHDEGVRVNALHLNDQLHGLLSQGNFVRASHLVTDYIGAVLGDAMHKGAATR